jgi:hypothetical protein
MLSGVLLWDRKYRFVAESGELEGMITLRSQALRLVII